MVERNFYSQKIPKERQSSFNGSLEDGVVSSLLADDLINLLALMVIEVERSSSTTCS